MIEKNLGLGVDGGVKPNKSLAAVPKIGNDCLNSAETSSVMVDTSHYFARDVLR